MPGPRITCLPLPLLQLHYQHQVVQNLHRLWNQYMGLPPKAEEARPGEEERRGPRARGAVAQTAYLEKAPVNVDVRTPGLESQLPRQENMALRDAQDSFRSPKSGGGARSFPQKGTMEERLAEDGPRELQGLSPPEWNLCLEDFRKVLP